MTLEPGAVVDQYRLDRTIRRGASTTVFAATELDSGRRVALEVLGDVAAADLATRQRFIDRAGTAMELGDHPNILTVLRWGRVGGVMYLVTELVDGISLADLLRRQPRRGPLPDDEALSLLEYVGAALDYAHQRGAVHGAIEPANVLMRMAQPRSALLGFGTDVEADASSAADYRAPELADDGRGPDAASDRYSFACLAFAVLTGAPPYADSVDDADRPAGHRHRRVPLASERRPGLPAAVDRVFLTALAEDPGQRPRHCADVLRALRAELRAAALRPIAPARDAGVTPLFMAPVTGPPRTRRWWPAALAAAGAVVLAVAAAMVTLDGGRDVAGGVGPGVVTMPATSAPTPVPTTTRPAATTTATPSTATPRPSTTTIAPTTTVVGRFGVVGRPITSPDGPESAYAFAVQERHEPSATAAPGSPAWYYLTWLHTVQPAGVEQPVSATAEGFAVVADERVELRDFETVEGRVSTFTECREGECVELASLVVPTRDCAPGPGCPHVRTGSGGAMAYQQATLTLRWPVQVLVYELVPEPDRPAIVAVDEPDRTVQFDAASGVLVATFPDLPTAGTIDQLTVTLADGTKDSLQIFYGG